MKLLRIILLAFCSAITCISASGQVLQSDSLALVALYNATNGPSWTNRSGWLTGPVSTWYGITVTSNRVTQIILGDVDNAPPQTGNNLTGTIPSQLGNLDQLQFLSLAGNNLSGSIPTELGNLVNCEFLYLFANNLTGAIPTQLGNMTNLVYLYLDENELSGTIPVSLGGLADLEILSLAKNNLTGSIPTELGNLSKLRHLWLYENQLTGDIPASLGNLKQLGELQLHLNQLTGAIPPELGSSTGLTHIFFGENKLSGQIPATLGNLPQLFALELQGNELTGSIPASLGQISSLHYMYLARNQLSGAIPAELGNLSNLEHLVLHINQLTGNIPSSLGNLTNLTRLDLAANQLSGSIPTSLGNLVNLTYLDLAPNNLSGPIPAQLGNLVKLQTLWINDNAFTGSIPSSFANFGNLNEFFLLSNELDQLPDFSDLPITTLDARNNYFTFEDLEPNIGIPDFRYSPQKNIRGGRTRVIAPGQRFEESFTVGGSANQYQWFKDGNPLASTNSNTIIIPAVTENDAGTYTLRATSPLVPNLTLTSEPIVLIVSAGAADIEVKRNGTVQPDGATLTFASAGIGSEDIRELVITNTGDAPLVIDDIIVTGDFTLVDEIPDPIAPGASITVHIAFSPSVTGKRSGTFTILSNGSTPSYVMNLEGEGAIDLVVYNVVTPRQNDKHDHLVIENITWFPENRVSIYDRWGNRIFDRAGYDNNDIKFAGTSDDGVDVPEGTYYFVIDKGNGEKRTTGFFLLRR